MGNVSLNVLEKHLVFFSQKRVRTLRLVIHIVIAYSLAAACTRAPICLREQGQVALSLMQMGHGDG